MLQISKRFKLGSVSAGFDLLLTTHSLFIPWCAASPGQVVPACTGQLGKRHVDPLFDS
jgi:hypothetical protein